MRFLAPLDALQVTLLRGGMVRLDQPIVFADLDGIHVTPIGVVTDGTSSPALWWPVLGHRLSYSLFPPSVQHDYQLEDALSKRARGEPHESRAAIDRRFYRALRAWGRGRVRATLHYLGTRLKACTIGPDWDGEGFTV
ncbi:DUF1353 domain-containing protein [Gemmatimonas sp.]